MNDSERSKQFWRDVLAMRASVVKAIDTSAGVTRYPGIMLHFDASKTDQPRMRVDGVWLDEQGREQT